MRKLPPLHALRAFEAAARHGHFGRAAEELNLDPTAISHQVRKLEALLEVALFQRRPLRLTDAGERLYPDLKEALDRMADAVHAVRQAKVRPVVVSMTMAFAAEWFTPRLRELRAITDVPIDVHADNAPADLQTGAVDIAIRSQRNADRDGIWCKLFDDRLIAVASPSFLERHGPVETTEAILRVPVIDYRWSSPSRRSLGWNAWLRAAGIDAGDMSVASSFTEESHAIQAAISGVGAALLSSRLVKARLQNGELVRIGNHAIPAPAFWAVRGNSMHPEADLETVVTAIRRLALGRE